MVSVGKPWSVEHVETRTEGDKQVAVMALTVDQQAWASFLERVKREAANVPVEQLEGWVEQQVAAFMAGEA